MIKLDSVTCYLRTETVWMFSHLQLICFGLNQLLLSICLSVCLVSRRQNFNWTKMEQQKLCASCHSVHRSKIWQAEKIVSFSCGIAFQNGPAELASLYSCGYHLGLTPSHNMWTKWHIWTHFKATSWKQCVTARSAKTCCLQLADEEKATYSVSALGQPSIHVYNTVLFLFL